MFLPYGRQVIDEDDIEAVNAVLRADFLTTGPKVAAFEEALQSATKAPHVLACSNGTTALHLACLAMEIGPGDAVIVPSLTFLASANAVRYCGAEVIFADVDPQTGIMDVSHAQEAFSRAQEQGARVKAVFCVHLGGPCADLARLSAFAKDNDLYLLADACHAVGGVAGNSPVGACQHEDFSTFSFHPVKTIAMGEGGAVTTRHPEAAERMRSLRSHGMVPDPQTGPWAYTMPELGYNYRVSDIQCALGLSQIKKLERFVKRRQELLALYNDALQDFSPHIQPPARGEEANVSWHLYAMRIDFEALGMTRAEMMSALRKKNVGTQVHYIPIHTQPYYRDLYGDLDLPGAAEYYARTLSFPLYPSMEDKDVAYVVDTLRRVIHG